MELLVVVLVGGAAILVVGVLLRWIVSHTNIGARDHSTMDPEEIVSIAEFSNAIEAELWRTRLNAAGVACTVTGQMIRTLVRFPNLFGPGIRLQVMAKDAQRAQAVLGAR